MEPKTKKKPTPDSREFKEGAVRLVLEEGHVAEHVSRDLGIASSTLSEWLKQARVSRGANFSGALTTSEKQELAQLRQENRVLKMEREILKKATAFLVKESR